MATDRPRASAARRALRRAGRLLVGCATLLAVAQPTMSLAQDHGVAHDHALRIEIYRANTAHGTPILVSPGYYLELRGDTVRSLMPYYGRAYMAPMAMGNAMDFTSTTDTIRTQRRPDGSTRLDFATRTIDDLMRFTVTIHPDGHSVIDVRPQRRERISYDGDAM